MLREIIEKFDDTVIVDKPVKKEYEITKYLLKYKDRPVLFKDVEGWEVAGNIWSTRDRIAKFLNTDKKGLLELLAYSMENPSKYEIVDDAEFLRNENEVNLLDLPVPKFYPKDGGRYFTSAIVVAKRGDFVNLSFHRMMILDENKAAIRIVPRHLYAMWKESVESGEELEVRIIVGNPIHVLLAGATSVAYGISELEIASTISRRAFGRPLEVVDVNGIPVPVESEFVFEAKITDEMVDEGPFFS